METPKQTVLDKATAPSPKWYRIFNKVYGNTETFVLAVLVYYYPQESKTMLIIKLSSSFVRSMVDSIMIESTTE